MPNQIQVIGRLGRDSEMKSTRDGRTFLAFSVGSDIGFGDNKETLWFKCTLWGKRADSLQQYLVKGQQVVVLGQVSLNNWTTNEGETRTDLQVNASDVWLAGSKPEGGVQRTVRPAAREKIEQEGSFVDDDDIPW